MDPAKVSSTVLFLVVLVIRVFVIPFILLAILRLAWVIAHAPSSDKNQEVSKRLAFWLGFAIFVLVVVVSLSTGFLTRSGTDLFSGLVSQNPLSDDVLLSHIALGVILGAAIMAGVHLLIRLRAISIFVALLATTSLAGLYYYILGDQLRDPILVVTISMLIGALAYAMFFPESLTNLRNP
jgi:hypothetical protein